MSRIDVSERKIKAITQAILESNFGIYGIGNYDLKANDYERFVRALLSNSPKNELAKLYEDTSF